MSGRAAGTGDAEWKAMAHDIFLGRCKRCKTAKRFVAPEVDRKHVSVRSGFEWVTRHNIVRDISAAAPFVGTNGATTARDDYDRRGSIWLVCPAGHNVEFKMLRGRKSDEPCSAKCLAATGNCCECACGGENHGVNHV